MNVSSARSYREWEMQEKITDFWYFRIIRHQSVSVHIPRTMFRICYMTAEKKNIIPIITMKKAAETGILKEEGHKLIDELFHSSEGFRIRCKTSRRKLC